MAAKQIKINLGCGEDKKDDYINIDFNSSVNPDVQHDLNKIPYPFSANYASEIEAFHILEHLDKPFSVMKELHRILKPGGRLIVKVPHFSRGITHAEHAHGFDVTFPLYFDPNFTKSGYFGVEYTIESIELHWMAFFHLLKYVRVGKFNISILRFLNKLISFFANLSPNICSRIWCFWVGGFDEIEFHFICKK